MTSTAPAISMQEGSDKRRRECAICHNHKGISIVASHTCGIKMALIKPTETYSLLHTSTSSQPDEVSAKQ